MLTRFVSLLALCKHQRPVAVDFQDHADLVDVDAPRPSHAYAFHSSESRYCLRDVTILLNFHLATGVVVFLLFLCIHKIGLWQHTYSSLTTNPTWAMQLKSNPSTAFSLQHLWSPALSRYVLGFMNIVGSTNFDAISCTPSCNWTTIPGVTPPYASPSSTRRGRFFSTIKRTVRRLWATTCTARRFKTPYVPAPG